MDNTKKDEAYRIKIEDRAMQTIEQSVNVVYDNSGINDEIKKGKKIFCMPDNFFVDHKIECGSNDINELFVDSILKWDEVFLGNKKSLNQIVRNITIEKSTSEPKKLGGKYPSSWEYKMVEKEKVKKENKQGYAHGNLELFFMNINVDVCKPRHIDQRLWRMIAAAKFFGIPKKRILKCKKYLLDAYFPIFDEALRIQIHEDTTIDDIKYVWEDIQRKQLAHKRGYGEKNININSKKKGKSRGLTTYERNKKVYELRQDDPGITNEKIKEQLGISGFNTNFDVSYITVILKKYKKYRNNGKLKNQQNITKLPKKVNTS
ncbi:hypothetical protein KAR28_04880 [Candidatus Parcubacteria bacterium]|nr:hypothetical protein [Candidatus Parcubacteria bacterium]